MGKLPPFSECQSRLAARSAGFLCRLLALVAVGAAVTGCGPRAPFPGAVHVTGIARFEGAPLTRGTVQFGAIEGNDGGTARIGAEGAFAVWLKPGDYRVAVIAYDGIERVDDKGIPLPQTAVIPERYFSIERSGLTASIDHERRTVDFDMQR